MCCYCFCFGRNVYQSRKVATEKMAMMFRKKLCQLTGRHREIIIALTQSHILTHEFNFEQKPCARTLNHNTNNFYTN